MHSKAQWMHFMNTTHSQTRWFLPGVKTDDSTGSKRVNRHTFFSGREFSRNAQKAPPIFENYEDRNIEPIWCIPPVGDIFIWKPLQDVLFPSGSYCRISPVYSVIKEVCQSVVYTDHSSPDFRLAARNAQYKSPQNSYLGKSKVWPVLKHEGGADETGIRQSSSTFSYTFISRLRCAHCRQALRQYVASGRDVKNHLPHRPHCLR
jgi:hypothetical protein